MSQTLRYVIHQLGGLSDWKTHLATVEIAINSLPNRSTGCSPFYLNYGYHLVVPSELLKVDEEIRNEPRDGHGIPKCCPCPSVVFLMLPGPSVRFRVFWGGGEYVCPSH